MIFVTGITGSIGCGKSTVTRLLGEMGALTLDADRLAREALAPGTPGLQQVVDRFGSDILLEQAPPAPLNRRLLAERVFADPAARRDLEAIVHPRVYRNMATTLADWEKNTPSDTPLIAALEIPLLLETNADPLCDLIVVVVCGQRQRERLQTRTGLSSSSLENIMQQQLPEQDKCQRAHWIIDNSHDPASTVHQTRLLWTTLQTRAQEARTQPAWPTRWDIFTKSFFSG